MPDDTTTDPTPDPLSPSMRAAVADRQARVAAFGESEVGPHEAALAALHDEAAQAPPCVFELGGEAFVLRKPTVPDLLALRRHLCGELRATFVSVLDATVAAFARMRRAAKEAGTAPPFDEEDYRAALKNAQAEEANPATKGRPEPTVAQLEDYLTTVAGVRKYVWFRLRLEHPQVTRAFVAAHVTDENMLAVMGRMGEDTGVPLVVPK